MGIFFTLILVSSCQKSVDFSGTWLLDSSQSNISFGDLLMEGCLDAPWLMEADLQMIIQQDKSRLGIKRIYSDTTGKEKPQIFHYDISGKTTTAYYNLGGFMVNSRAFLKAKKLVVTSTQYVRGMPITSEATWYLSLDNKTLTIETTPNFNGNGTKKEVYSRKL